MLKQSIFKIDKASVAFWLDVLLGLLGIFGLGHLYFGSRTRAYHFLSLTAVLGALVAWAFLAPSTLPPLLGAPGMPTIWFIGWIAQIYDIRNVTMQKNTGKQVRDVCPVFPSKRNLIGGRREGRTIDQDITK